MGRMSLYKRLHEVRPRSEPAGPHHRDPVLDELRQRIHHHLIDELGPILYDKRLSEDDLRRRVHQRLRSALAHEQAPLSAADEAQLIQDVSDDFLGYRPIDRLTIGLIGGGVAMALPLYTALSQADEKAVVRASLPQLDDYEVGSVRESELLAPLRARAVLPILTGLTGLGRRVTSQGYIDDVNKKLVSAGQGRSRRNRPVSRHTSDHRRTSARRCLRGLRRLSSRKHGPSHVDGGCRGAVRHGTWFGAQPTSRGAPARDTQAASRCDGSARGPLLRAGHPGGRHLWSADRASAARPGR